MSLPNLLRRRAIRRTLAAALIVVGALLMLLAPNSPGGAIALVVGVTLELLGLHFERGR